MSKLEATGTAEKYRTFCRPCNAETEHYRSSWTCVACAKRQSREYRRKHPDRVKQYQRKWAQSHPEQASAWRRRHPEKARAIAWARAVAEPREQKRRRNRRSAYRGMTATRPEPALCECCGDWAVSTLHFDHDHQAKVFRGWLCSACNTGIGLFRDDPVRLQQAIDYLRANKPS